MGHHGLAQSRSLITRVQATCCCHLGGIRLAYAELQHNTRGCCCRHRYLCRHHQMSTMTNTSASPSPWRICIAEYVIALTSVPHSCRARSNFSPRLRAVCVCAARGGSEAVVVGAGGRGGTASDSAQPLN